MAAKKSVENGGSRFLDRRERLVQKIIREKLDGFLVTDPINVSYLTGFSGEDSVLLVAKGLQVIVSDSRFTEQIEEECPGLAVHIRRPGESMDAAIRLLFKRGGASGPKRPQFGFESTHVTVARLTALQAKTEDFEWVGKAGLVEKMRVIKDADEVKQIRSAIQMAERAFGMFRAFLSGSDEEKTLADRMDQYLRQCGAQGSSFPPIIAVGARAALPHAVPTSQRIAESDFVLIDWGAKGRFYCSDLTRVLVPGRITRKFAKVYETVLTAQLKAIDAIKPGVTAGSVDAAARDHISKAGYGPKFGHSLGHGLGIQVHEEPGLRAKSEVLLRPGMVVTVEPGIYIPGWGGVRIEDDVLVTRDGAEVLSNLTKNLEEMTVG